MPHFAPFAPVKIAALACLVTACGGSDKKEAKRPYPAPSAEEIVATLEREQAKARSFIAESRMEYWSGAERIKPTVLVMGTRGAKVRFNALNPTGSTVAADLACNGQDFQFIDFNKNCALTGPCQKGSIAQLLRVNLSPDDFFLLAIGSTPMLQDATSSLKWDGENQREHLTLQSKSTGQKQVIEFSGRNQNWDVLTSTLWNAQGEVEWQLTNKSFSPSETVDGKSLRLPERTRFAQPGVDAELTIRWVERSINDELEDAKFVMDMPDVPVCQ